MSPCSCFKKLYHNFWPHFPVKMLIWIANRPVFEFVLSSIKKHDGSVFHVFIHYPSHEHRRNGSRPTFLL